MANKRIVISGGEYGRRPMALDAETGQFLWDAPLIIDEGSMMWETPAGNVFIADRYRRCVVMTKDGVVVRQGGFVEDPEFTTAMKAAILVKYPDATFGVHEGNGRLPEIVGSINDRRSFTTSQYSDSVQDLGGGQYYVRIRDLTFGNDIAGVPVPNPANWQHPYAVLVNYDLDTGAYSNLKFIGNTTADGPVSIHGGISYGYETHSANYVYCRGVDSNNYPTIMRISRTTGDVVFKRISAENVAYLWGFNAWADGGYLPVSDGTGKAWWLLEEMSGDYSKPVLVVKNMDSMFNRTAPIAGSDFMFDDLADFDSATSIVGWWEFTYSTNFTQSMIDNFGASISQYSIFDQSWATTQEGYVVTRALSFYDSTAGSNKWFVFKFDLINQTVEWLDEFVYDSLRAILSGSGATEINSLQKVWTTPTHLYGQSNMGWHKVTRGTNTYENLYLIPEDDEDWTENSWMVEWPTFEIPCTVVSPATSDVADVMLYDEATGQFLRTVSVDSSQVLECFTNSHKFAVCKSPDEDTNYKISAHLVPELSV